MNDLEFIYQLLETLGPSRADIMIVGGWAHRLMSLHPLATRTLDVLTTKDVDLLIEPGVEGLGERLRDAGFEQRMRGDDRPPISDYLQKSNPGAPVEFIAVERPSRTEQPSTREINGVSASLIKGLDLLLVEPWHISLSSPSWPSKPPIEIRIPNPIAFSTHKVLIARKRPARDKRDKDILYAYDTFSLFAGQDTELNNCGRLVREELSKDQLKRLKTMLREMTAASDAVQGAALVAHQTRRPNPPRPAQISTTLIAAFTRYLQLSP